jgi:1-acyl-sn-glycerol-3-phosphate acyltransferase
MDRAIEELRDGRCIGVFPEGTRSLGRPLRARSGFGRLAEAVPEAHIICCTVEGTVDIPKFPKSRPHVRVRFFPPRDGQRVAGESALDLGVRLLTEIRASAPIRQAGRKQRPIPPMPEDRRAKPGSAPGKPQPTRTESSGSTR